MKEFLACYRAYNNFLLADGVNPVANELGNLLISVLILSVANFFGLLIYGILIASTLVVSQKYEAYVVGKTYLRTGSVQATRNSVKFRYGIK